MSGDLGLAYAPEGAIGAVDRVFTEVAVFGAQPRDAIGFVPSAGRVAVAILRLGWGVGAVSERV